MANECEQMKAKTCASQIAQKFTDESTLKNALHHHSKIEKCFCFVDPLLLNALGLAKAIFEQVSCDDDDAMLPTLLCLWFALSLCSYLAACMFTAKSYNFECRSNAAFLKTLPVSTFRTELKSQFK